MRRVLLYYPTIEFPSRSWLQQALLYSDKVASIVPSSREIDCPESMKFLIDQGQYNPVNIQKLIHDNRKEYDIFATNFLSEIDKDPRILRATSKSTRSDKFNFIFNSKLSHKVIQALKDRNLIIEETEKGYFMLENVSLYYMANLAKFSSYIISDDLYIPSTDYRRFSNISFENGIESHQALNLVFSKCLPVPHPTVSLSKIINFKKKHYQDLLKFRLFYIDTQNALKKCKDRYEMNETLIQLSEKISFELSELSRMYTKDRLKLMFSSLSALLNIDSPYLIKSLLASNIISHSVDPKLGLGIGAILISGKLIDNALCKPNKTNEINYLFEATKKGILQ